MTQVKLKIRNAEKIWQIKIVAKNRLSNFCRNRSVSSKQNASANKNKAHKIKTVVSLFVVFTSLKRAEMNSL